MKKSNQELVVGLFMIAGIVALVFLALKVSGLTRFHSTSYYTVYAEFDDVGNLKVRAPVSMAGVKVGEVSSILLDPVNFRARVTLLIDQDHNKIPSDTQASIFTQGLLGSNYIGLSPGYAEDNLKNGDTLPNTSPAIILEKLIGQLIFSLKGDSKTVEKKVE